MRLQAPQLWTAGQRVALLAIIAGLFVYLAVRYFVNSTYVSNPQPAEPTRAAELVDRIDPNTADAATLAALPTLGEKRAKLIVDYRESRRASRSDVIVFQRPEDLLRIRGIGAATIDQLRPFLTFPTTVPATKPAGD